MFRSLRVLWMGLLIVVGAKVAAGQTPEVGVVDIAQVFRQHAGFKQKLEELKQEIVAFDREMAEQRQAVVQLQTRHKSLAVGSAEQRRLDEQLARTMSDVQVRQELKQKEIREREARIYYETYNEVQGQIARLANQYRLSLILRYEGQPIDEHNHASVMAGMNRQVLFQRNLDLTPHVIAAVNPSSARSAMQSRNLTTVK